MEEASDADYVVILDAGKISAEGTPLELKNNYTGDYITIYGVSEEEVRKLNHKSIHEDIFDDIIDYNKKTILQVYIKNSSVMYIGTFKVREEKGSESYIALIDYAAMDVNTRNVIFNPNKKNLNSSVIINLRDVERIEVIYAKDSDLWNYLIN